MPNTFTTDWKKIGQSGPTVDGREIEGQWLLDAAEEYDPAKYTAVIWIDHYRFYGNFGKVVALKTEEKDGIVSLYAKLQPNEWLLSQNKDKQKLFTSMELTPDFAKSGKFYLTGLAVTDIPASLGTSELHFPTANRTPPTFLLTASNSATFRKASRKLKPRHGSQTPCGNSASIFPTTKGQPPNPKRTP